LESTQEHPFCRNFLYPYHKINLLGATVVNIALTAAMP